MMFDEPDADWTDAYPWTRYRGPQPYPVPEDWVLSLVEGDGVIWRRYDDAENGHEAEKTHDIDDDVEWAGADDEAMLGHDWPAGADVMEDDPYHELLINGELVLVLTDSGEGWWRAVAETLARYARGEDYLATLDDLGLEHLNAQPFDDGEPENRSLGDFS